MRGRSPPMQRISLIDVDARITEVLAEHKIINSITDLKSKFQNLESKLDNFEHMENFVDRHEKGLK